MKKILLLFSILVVYNNIYSQNSKYSISLNSGVFIPNDNLQYYKAGWNVGCEMQLYSKPIAYFVEFNMNFMERKDEYYINNESNRIIIAELTAGPRYIMPLGKVNPFIDIGAGAYVVKYKTQATHVGISSGIGLLFNINKKFDIITKFKFHPHLVLGEGAEIVDYFGAYGGIKYNF